jgi:hypothetical protein
MVSKMTVYYVREGMGEQSSSYHGRQEAGKRAY